MTRPVAVLPALAAALVAAGCGGTFAGPAAAGTGVAVKHRTTDAVADALPAARNGQPDERAERRKPKPPAGSALVALDHLRVKGRAPKTGYDRDRFGAGWATVDSCDTRDRILARDLGDIVFAIGSDCRIQSGVLSDPYTATRVEFVRGGASEVDIDHVVALGDAWQKGAQHWSYERRVQFANDPLNLLSADASANRQKGDGDAASWLPRNKSSRCDYVARQIAVKRRYRAWVTGAEKDAMTRVLGRCPNQTLPTSRRVRIQVAPRPQPTPTRKPRHGAAPYFENCDAVRAAGLAPLTRGDGIYEHNTHMDRDGDGMACE